ncbi:MAG: nitroreductase family protein [Granulosicoccus sp.]
MEESNKGITALADYGKSETVSSATRSRHSLRVFLPTSVPAELVERILSVAPRVPSGTNMQLWKTYVLTGNAKQSLCNSACQAFDDPGQAAASEVVFYPEK